jgi:hypothetical protein
VGNAGQPSIVSNLNKKIYTKIEAGGTGRSKASIPTSTSTGS